MHCAGGLKDGLFLQPSTSKAAVGGSSQEQELGYNKVLDAIVTTVIVGAHAASTTSCRSCCQHGTVTHRHGPGQGLGWGLGRSLGRGFDNGFA